MNSLEKSYEEYLKNKTKGALKNDKNIYQAGFIAGLSRGAKLAALRAYPVRAIWNEIEKMVIIYLTSPVGFVKYTITEKINK